MILLDTHAWLWWLSDPSQLSEAAADAIARAVRDEAVYISAISAWEVAMLVARGRLSLDRSATAFVTATEALPFVHFVDVDARLGVASVELDLVHADPADRLIAASARLIGAPLVTKDARLQEWGGVETVW